MQAKLKEMEDEAAKLREEDESSSVKDDPQMEQEAAAEGDEGVSWSCLLHWVKLIVFK